MFRSWLVAGTSALLIGLVACGGGDDGASVRNLDPCPTSTTVSGSASATGASGSATEASGSASGSATGASGSASGTEC